MELEKEEERGEERGGEKRAGRRSGIAVCKEEGLKEFVHLFV